MEVLSKGFFTAFALFAAIGAQNTFVLKQGIMKNHVLLVCVICILCDVFFVSLGVFGVAKLIAHSKIISSLLGVLGFIFVLAYGLLSLRSAIRANEYLKLTSLQRRDSVKKIVFQTLAVTLLNPSVYLDTIVILGAMSLSLDIGEKFIFSFGVILASCIWFVSISFAAKKTSVLFKSTKTWAMLHVFTALVMFYIAYGLYGYVIEFINYF